MSPHPNLFSVHPEITYQGHRWVPDQKNITCSYWRREHRQCGSQAFRQMLPWVKNYPTFPTLVQTWENNLRRWREGRKRRSFSMTVHWAAPWPKIDLQTRVKSDEIFYHIFSNLSGMKTNWSYVPPHLVMPPGPGPTSTTWQPAREPPDLATRSSSLGSIMKFWESRFWAWKRNCLTSTTQMLLNV